MRGGGWSGQHDDPTQHDVPGDGDRKEERAGSVTSTNRTDAPVAHRHTGWFCCPEQINVMAERILLGQCCTAPRASDGSPWCLTHVVPADYGHYLEQGRGT